MSTKVNTCSVPDGYEVFTNVLDTLGRTHRVCAWPVRGGSIAYFDKLSDMRVWSRQVTDVRKMARGEMAFNERMMVEINTGNIDREVGMRCLSSVYPPNDNAQFR